MTISFKVYTGTTPKIINSIRELAVHCNVSVAEARKAFYRRVSTVGYTKVINLGA